MHFISKTQKLLVTVSNSELFVTVINGNRVVVDVVGAGRIHSAGSGATAGSREGSQCIT